MALPARSNFYVYYRVAEEAADARAVIDALMKDVEARTGISGRLLARCDDSATWMEIYESVADAPAFASALDACVLANGAADVAINGLRTTERFCALAPDRTAGGARRG